MLGIVGPEAASYHRTLLRTRPELIDPGIRALLIAGLLLPVEQYLKALEARAAITAAIRDTFSDHALMPWCRRQSPTRLLSRTRRSLYSISMRIPLRFRNAQHRSIQPGRPSCPTGAARVRFNRSAHRSAGYGTTL